MVTKKKVVKPKPEIKEPVKRVCLIIQPEIKFKEIEVVASQKYEFNYVSIRRKIIWLGKITGIISQEGLVNKMKRIAQKIKPKEKISLWSRYENWFNSRINPKLSSVSELLSAKWRKIKFKADNPGENKSEP